MDGHFVPNLTMGPDLCRCLRARLPGAFLDVHLMVTDPGKFVEPFAKAGANLFTFHVEVVTATLAADLAAKIRGHGMGVGIAINPPTPVDAIFPVLGLCDMALVMSVNPGYSGQAFIASTLDKTRAIRARLRSDQRLQMDGGIGPAQAGDVRAAGCDVVVAASAIFKQARGERAGVVGGLRG
jgi:ribulose-phosphate 3-epimerase